MSTVENAASAAAATPRAAVEVDRRAVILWEVATFVVVMIGASALHLAFELSGFWRPLAVVASVNESTFEHLKLFFWPALIVAFVQHAYVKGRVNNYWWGKAMALLATPIAIVVSFYFYLGIALPLTGRGYLALDIGTGAFGVAVGNVVAYRLLTAPEKGLAYRSAGLAIIAVTAVVMATVAFAPPPVFLFENFFGYEYTGEFGILDDYTPYLVFTGR
ncbi:MAG: DUF6512 family protein [Chloroflexota bacterium]